MKKCQIKQNNKCYNAFPPHIHTTFFLLFFYKYERKERSLQNDVLSHIKGGTESRISLRRNTDEESFTNYFFSIVTYCIKCKIGRASCREIVSSSVWGDECD